MITGILDESPRQYGFACGWHNKTQRGFPLVSSLFALCLALNALSLSACADKTGLRVENPDPKKSQVVGQECTVQVQFYLNAEGEIVEGPVVRKSSGFPELDDEAIRMIKATKFPPLKGLKKDKHMVVKKINCSLVDAQ